MSANVMDGHQQWLDAMSADMRGKGLCGEVCHPNGEESICVLPHPCLVHADITFLRNLANEASNGLRRPERERLREIATEVERLRSAVDDVLVNAQVLWRGNDMSESTHAITGDWFRALSEAREAQP